jgi:hypothetical protein
MALNITQIQNLVQDITDNQIGVGSNFDFTPDLFLAYTREAYQRIVSTYSRWPWFQATYELTTIENQRVYTTGFNQVAPTVQSSLDFADIREIISVVNETDSGNQLIYIDNFKADSIWVGTNDQANIPNYFALWADSLQLWPKPDDVYELTIRGFRQPSYEWITNSALDVDLNDEFHIMLINFIVARIFQFQEDPEMAAVYMAHFEQGVALSRTDLTGPNANQPLILSGGLQTDPMSFSNYMKNLAIRAVRTGEWT